MSSDDIKKYLDDNYQKRKGWYGSTDLESLSYIFSTETRRASIRPHSKILEIGFGEGNFLDWAKANSHKVIGIERNTEFINLAKSRGHKVYSGSIENVFKDQKEVFDLIVIFDVLEHMSYEEIFNLFIFLRKLLRREGKMLCRIPNGLSPFGRYHQYGDATHKNVLSSKIIEDIVQPLGLKVLSVYNSARYMNDRWHRSFFKLTALVLRHAIQFIIGYIYFGRNTPLDPNITVIIGIENRNS